MNAAEIKLDLFRKIDRLNEAELEMVYASRLCFTIELLMAILLNYCDFGIAIKTKHG